MINKTFLFDFYFIVNKPDILKKKFNTLQGEGMLSGHLLIRLET